MALHIPLAGVLLALSVLTALASGFGGLPPVVPGTLQLACGILLWLRVPVGVRQQSLCLVLIGFGCQMASLQAMHLSTALSKNQQMIAMLSAIGLLRHVPLDEIGQSPPQGPKALWQTLFGVHWMGSVINISALAIFADRITSPTGRLESFQGVVLARGFAMAALWSPFFVAMGVALTYAPGADYRILVLWGLPISQLLLAGMAWYTMHCRPVEVSEFHGYPFHPATLIGPAFLVIAVLIGHILAPDVSIVTLITLLAPCFALLVNWRNRPLHILSQYVFHDMPGMASEIVLFAAAGILGTGLSSLIAGHTMSLTGEYSPIFQVAVGVAVILAMSCVGIHSVVGITVVGGVLAGTNLPPNLLAMSFLMSWGLGIIINPISGIHLFMSGRYAFPGHNSCRLNFRFVVMAYVGCCVWLAIFYGLS